MIIRCEGQASWIDLESGGFRDEVIRFGRCTVKRRYEPRWEVVNERESTIERRGVVVVWFWVMVGGWGCSGIEGTSKAS